MNIWHARKQSIDDQLFVCLDDPWIVPAMTEAAANPKLDRQSVLSTGLCLAKPHDAHF